MKIGSKDYTVAMNNSPDVIDSINAFPVAQVGGKTVFMRDIAHVHDGFQVQTNSVSVDGTPGALITIRKTGGVSTLAVIDGVRDALTDIRKVMPSGVSIKPIFDQSIFVNAALSSVKMGGLMAAGLTALMILLFLGNWRLTLIILAAIPLSIITAVLVMYVGGQTLNTMTLGGFALAVGILVDNGTVVIENIERHVGLGEPLAEAIVGRRERGRSSDLPGDAVHLYRFRAGVPAARHRKVPVFAAVAVGVRIAARQPGAVVHDGAGPVHVPDALAVARASMRPSRRAAGATRTRPNPFMAIHLGFNRGFERFRESYRDALAWTLSNRCARCCSSRC